MVRAMTDDPTPRGVGVPSDRSLLARLTAGQQDAATQLYLKYADRLRALAFRQRSGDLARRVDTDDIVQSVFRTFFRRAARGEYEAPEGEELWKLFLVIALNKIREVGAFHRAAKRNVGKTVSGAAFERAMAIEPGKDEEALRSLKETIDELLEGLGPSRREMIELRIEGYEVAEIAERVGRSKRSVERVLQEFRKSLTRWIEEP